MLTQPSAGRVRERGVEGEPMDQMRTALRGLAETATTAAADDPSALWSQGRRRVRRRRLAAVGAVAAAVVAAGALSVVVVPTSVIYPAGSSHDPAIPRNVWSPRDWYPTTSEEGPPGVVAVLGGLSREDGNGLFAVSATTGEYRLLDLPDAMDGNDGSGGPALAPDGRHIAYWLAGEPAGEPYADVSTGPGGEATIPIGLGVYDTVEGTVQRFEPETEHGLSADDLVWADDDTLLLTYGQRTSATSAEGIATYVWDTAADPVPDRTVETYGARPGRDVDGALIDLRGRRRAVTVPLDGGTPRVLVRLPRSRTFGAGSVWASRDAVLAEGNQLLGGPNTYGNDRALVAQVRADGTLGRLRRVQGAASVRPVGWIDDTRMVVLGAAAPGDSWGSLFVLDLDTRTLERLGTAEAGMYTPGLDFATDLLDAPMVEGDRPPRLDPFWPRAGAGAVLALLGAGGVLLVRGRRRG